MIAVDTAVVRNSHDITSFEGLFVSLIGPFEELRAVGEVDILRGHADNPAFRDRVSYPGGEPQPVTNVCNSGTAMGCSFSQYTFLAFV